MRLWQAILAGIFLLSASSSSVFAAESSVDIHNTVNSSSSTTSTTNSKCHTHTEVNGKVIDSDDCNVEIHNDGTSVSIKNNTSPTQTTTPYPTSLGNNSNNLNPTNEPTKVTTDEAKPTLRPKEKEAPKKDIFKEVEEFIKNLFQEFIFHF